MSKELEAQVKTLTKENTSLKETVTQKDQDIASLKEEKLKYETNLSDMKDLSNQKSLEIADLKKTVATVEEEKLKLKDKLETAAKTGKAPSIPIAGTLKVSWEKPDGEKVSKIVKFADGRKFTPLKDGRKVPSESLMLIANGKAPAKEHLEKYNFLVDVTKEVAIERITWLAQIGATSVEEVK